MERDAALGSMVEATARRDEWLLLAAGIDASFARAGVRYFLIKGAVPDARGLRGPKHSADLDVLVHPDDAVRAARALATWGWASSISAEGGGVRAPHAETLIHRGWSISIDLHHRFPGFTEGASRAFEALWEHREPLIAAGRTVVAPDRIGVALVEALNAMRSGAVGKGVRASQEAGSAAIVALGADEVAQLDACANRAGAAYAMAPVLGTSTALPANADQLAWDLALAGAGPFEAQATADLYTARGLGRLAALTRVVWPRREVFVASYGLDHATRTQVLGARLARAGRALAKLPRGLTRVRALGRISDGA